MMERQHGKFVFECDACGEALETGSGDFNQARVILHQANWRSAPIGSDWVHTCSGCAERTTRDQRARRAGRIP